MSQLLTRFQHLLQPEQRLMPELAEPGHEIICGTIGMGKSYWVLYKIIKSFLHDRPCCYIDPKGDTYRNLVAFFVTSPQGQALWAQYRHRILLMNPLARSNWLVSFNAVEPVQAFAGANPDRIALLANSVVSHIRKQSGFEVGEANRMQNIMSAAIGLLAEGGRGQLTLAELPLLFVQTYATIGGKRVAARCNPLVQALLAETCHHGTLSFWQDQWPNWTADARREWVQSTEGRIFQYLFDERMLMTVCAVQNAKLDLRRLVDEGYWLFVNIPYALLSDTISTLLGNLLITKILYACLQRPPGARPYRLILDEARFFSTGPLDALLETARAYNLWLTLVLQNLDQLSRTVEGRVDPRLKETALNNCRYFSVFHNAADGQLFARMMYPLTGQVPVAVRASGDWERLPVPAERNAQERRFMDLGQREMVQYDKLNGATARVRRTPQVVIRSAEQTKLDMLEAGHLQVTGSPAWEIRAEIRERQARAQAMLTGGKPADQGGQPPQGLTPRTLERATFRTVGDGQAGRVGGRP